MPRVERQSISGLARNLYVFGLTSFLNDTASEMAYWVMPALLLSLGAGPAALGLIEGVAESVASLAKLFSGYVADRVPRRKPIVVSGYVVANAVKPLLAVVTGWWQVLLIRFADRLAKGARGTPRDVMLAESVPREKLGSSFGLLQAMDSAGAIAGPLLALGVLSRFGLRAVFWTAALPGFLCIAVAALAIRETGGSQAGVALAVLPGAARLGPPALDDAGAVLDPLPPAAENRRPQLVAGSPRAETHLPPAFYFLLLAVGLFSLGNSSDMFLVLRAQSAGIAAAYAPLLGVVFNITYTAFSWPAGRLSDWLSKPAMAAAGYGVFAAVYLVFAAAPSRPILWVSMAAYGLFYALTSPVLRALVVESVPSAARGRALGIFFFVTSVAALLASVITGELWKHYGPQLPFYLSGGLAATAALLLLLPRVKRAAPPVPA